MTLKLGRLFSVPSTHVEAVDGDTVRLRIDGLVCDSVCAVRTKRAIESLEGVRSARVDFEHGTVTVDGTPAAPEAYDRVVQAVVGGMWLRRALAEFSHVLRPESPR